MKFKFYRGMKNDEYKQLAANQKLESIILSSIVKGFLFALLFWAFGRDKSLAEIALLGAGFFTLNLVFSSIELWWARRNVK